MDHTQAISTGAAERYALNEMDEPERDDYEEHFFGCAACAEEVKAATRFLDAAKPLAHEHRATWAPATTRGERPAAVARAPWSDVRALFWPMPLGAAAALALALGGPALYLATVKVPRLEQAVAEADSLQPAAWHFLSVSRAEPPTVAIAAGERRLGLTLSRSGDKSFPFYLCELRDAKGATVLSSVIPNAAGRDELQILVPADKLPAGAYVVAVAGLESAASRAPASEFTRYHFSFTRTDDRRRDR